MVGIKSNLKIMEVYIKPKISKAVVWSHLKKYEKDGDHKRDSVVKNVLPSVKRD